MPTDERLHKAGKLGPVTIDGDLESEKSMLAQATVLAGSPAGNPEPLYIGGIRQDASGRGGAGADAAFYNASALGEDATLGALTAVTISTGAGAAGTINVAFTKPGGVGSAEVLVYKNSDKSFVTKGDLSVTGVFTDPNSLMQAATSYDVILRPIASDGLRVGASQSKTTVTSHA